MEQSTCWNKDCNWAEQVTERVNLDGLSLRRKKGKTNEAKEGKKGLWVEANKEEVH